MPSATWSRIPCRRSASRRFWRRGREARPSPGGGFGEETASALFYTSGTTGDPKGVLYSHRSTMLNAMILGLRFALTPRDVAMPVVPMFHANGWGYVHIGPMTGASLVMPGPSLDPASLHQLIVAEGVTVAAGVPTVWQALLDHLGATGGTIPTLRRLVTAGAGVPQALIRDFGERHGVEVVAAWGMTETGASGTGGGHMPLAAGDAAARLAAAAKPGRAMFGVELAIKDDDDSHLPHDGVAAGRLMVRGPAVIRAYYRSDAPATDTEGYLDTGDIASIEPHGTLRITDRAKDLIKSGGEWISSLAIEDAATLHSAVAVCAVIGIPDKRWDERPLLLVKCRPGHDADAAEIRAHLAERIQKWWIPEEIRFVDELPLGATGKVDKKALRKTIMPMA